MILVFLIEYFIIAFLVDLVTSHAYSSGDLPSYNSLNLDGIYSKKLLQNYNTIRFNWYFYSLSSILGGPGGKFSIVYISLNPIISNNIFYISRLNNLQSTITLNNDRSAGLSNLVA